MDYEKKYKEALEKARKLCTYPTTNFQSDLEDLFPELKENVDEWIEKIRKGIISYLNNRQITSIAESSAAERWIAWLEKQGKQPKKVSIWKHWKDGIAGGAEGEQIFLIKIGTIYSISSCLGCECDYIELSELDKLMREEKQGKTALEAIKEEKVDNTNKIEPKFKVGDWCIDNEDGVIFQIVKVLDNTYTYKTNEGKEYSCTHYSLENDAKLWTIQEAKDGDVLVCGVDEKPFIFEGLLDSNHPNYPVAYCGIDPEGYFCVSPRNYWWTNDNIKPATKEQRDLLFSKMKEAGYEWNPEKKELMRIELHEQKLF